MFALCTPSWAAATVEIPWKNRTPILTGDGCFVRVKDGPATVWGHTQDGRPIYEAAIEDDVLRNFGVEYSKVYIYFDADCDGKGSLPNRWIWTSTRPSKDKPFNLLNGVCPHTLPEGTGAAYSTEATFDFFPPSTWLWQCESVPLLSPSAGFKEHQYDFDFEGCPGDATRDSFAYEDGPWRRVADANAEQPLRCERTTTESCPSWPDCPCKNRRDPATLVQTLEAQFDVDDYCPGVAEVTTTTSTTTTTTTSTMVVASTSTSTSTSSSTISLGSAGVTPPANAPVTDGTPQPPSVTATRDSKGGGGVVDNTDDAATTGGGGNTAGAPGAEVEPPTGTKEVDGATVSVYTAEQQGRLCVDEFGATVVGWQARGMGMNNQLYGTSKVPGRLWGNGGGGSGGGVGGRGMMGSGGTVVSNPAYDTLKSNKGALNSPPSGGGGGGTNYGVVYNSDVLSTYATAAGESGGGGSASGAPTYSTPLSKSARRAGASSSSSSASAAAAAAAAASSDNAVYRPIYSQPGNADGGGGLLSAGSGGGVSNRANSASANFLYGGVGAAAAAASTSSDNPVYRPIYSQPGSDANGSGGKGGGGGVVRGKQQSFYAGFEEDV
eukprot:gene21346-18883_t